MTKRAFSAVAGLLSLYLPLFAQQMDRPDIFSALDNSLLRLPSLTLSDGGLFSFSSAFNWMETTTPDFLPALNMPSTTARSHRATASAQSATDSYKESVDVQRRLVDYATGEVGVLFGRSSGKFGRELESGYILGEVGDDKFNITVGAAYEHSSGRVPRFGR